MDGDMYQQDMQMQPPPDRQAPSPFKKGSSQEAAFGEQANQIRDTSRRLRIIEERYSSLRKNIQVNEQNMLSEGKRVSSEIKVINSDISEIKHILNEIKNEMRMIVTEVKESVKKEELKVVEKYVSLWEPINFVTTSEVEKIVLRKIDERLAQIQDSDQQQGQQKQDPQQP
jgi:hypothetical protein